jgi:hypothetical protein
VYLIAQVKSRGFPTDLGKQWYAIEAWRPKKFEVFEVKVTRLHVLDTRVANTLPQSLEEALLNKSDGE